ncbi:MAG: hypothetical protein ACE5G0_04230 [Rhodothermales bacterium]
MKTPEAAFRWIVDILTRKRVPFQIVGGLAARAYGSTRDLADLDFYIPGARFPDLIPDVSPFVTFGPAPFADEHWDLVFMALEYDGWTIELGDGDSTRIFDRHTQQWVHESIDFERFERKMLFGLPVPVMPRDRLIAYKRRLDRAVDREDLALISPS